MIFNNEKQTNLILRDEETMARKDLHVVRSILRRLKTKVDLLGGKDSSAPTREFVRQFVRQQRDNDDDVDRLRSFGQEYDQLLGDLMERKRLLDLDTGAEVVLSPKEMSRRAAARAGLQLPQQVHIPDDDDDEGKTPTRTTSPST